MMLALIACAHTANKFFKRLQQPQTRMLGQILSMAAVFDSARAAQQFPYRGCRRIGVALRHNYAESEIPYSFRHQITLANNNRPSK